MSPRLLRPGLPALAALLLLAADPPRRPSIMALMQRQYNVSRAPFKILKAEMDAPSPDWGKAAEAATKFADLAKALAEHTPRQGTVESWRTFMTQHLADARAMSDATKSHDPKALRAAHGRIAESCNACHKAHRKRRGD